MAKRYTITFIGDERTAQGLKQVHFAPWCPRGLKPGQSVIVLTLPDCVKGSGRHRFLVDGEPYQEPPKKPAKAKDTPKE